MTTPNMRLTEADRAMIVVIQKKLDKLGVTANATDAVRYALKLASKESR